jgi:hypothetical protein
LEQLFANFIYWKYFCDPLEIYHDPLPGRDPQGIAGLDCWIAQSGLQSSLVDWIVIDNPKSKMDFGF